jgi:membrane protein DedA with SNARE-associated domain
MTPMLATIKFTWLLAAVVLAGWLITRRHKQERWFQVVELIAIAAALVVGLGIVHLPNFEKVLEDVGSSLGQWTYLVVGALAFAETGAFLGFIAPGETAVIVGGLVAGQGQISLLALIAIVWACAVLGDVTSYELGRQLGRNWLLRHGARLKITDERLDQVEGFFERRGGATILIGRFLGFVRPIAPFIAGASKMPFRRFLPYDVLAAGAWSTTFCVLGYLFWRSIDKLTTYVSRGLFAFGTLVVVIALIVALIRLRRDPELRAKVAAWLDERADQKGWKHVVKLARPTWRFLGRPAAAVADMTARFSADRLTPGNLGLELTTMLALLAVGSFSFFLLGDIVLQPGEPRIDRWAADLADRLKMDALVNLAKAVSLLGSLGAAVIAAVLTAGFAVIRRRFIDAAALVVGLTPAAREPARGHRSLVVPLRPRVLRRHARRVRDDPRPRRRRLGRADRRHHGRRGGRRGRRRQPRLPQRPLPDRRARRHRAGRRDLVAGRRARVVRRARASE